MTNGEQPPREPADVQRVEYPVRPHRGGLILVLGILGLLCCVFFGILAWVLASTDLREMREGRMDPAGWGLTRAGQVCGIISVVVWIAYILVWIWYAPARGPAPGGRWV
jgi:hypothetical protein